MFLRGNIEHFPQDLETFSAILLFSPFLNPYLVQGCRHSFLLLGAHVLPSIDRETFDLGLYVGKFSMLVANLLQWVRRRSHPKKT